MTQSTRKLIGIFGLLGVTLVYCIAAGAIYASFLGGWPWWVLILYFTIAGLGWFVPATWVIRWMSRPDA